ncbi:MAG TPA: DUF2946 family protein [Ideonella sp.]|nr:DUF2946 family protein [Ideonella sp.]
MKLLRVWLLILLAVLLPARGVVAAAMLCPVGSHAAVVHEQALALDDHHGGHHDKQHDHGHGSVADTCNMCSAFCSMAPLASSAPAPLPVLDAATTVFPETSAPVARFQSDGPERPPRSI